ncbi:hypothetical protein JN350_11390 [Curtobacterium sp. 24E2]|nr:hypothetical protein JN350_11390 [Curtobacterium sp. 24E2]
MEQHLGCGALLDEHPVTEHPDPAAVRRDQRQVVADEQGREADLGPELVDERHDARLDRAVQARRGFVEHEQARTGHQGHGDRDALLLTAGQLVRVPHADRRRRRQPDAGERLDRRGVRSRAAGARGAQHLGDLASDRHRRVEGEAGFLVDDRHDVAPEPPQPLTAQGRDVDAVDDQRRRLDGGVRAERRRQRAGHGALAGAGLAHEPVRATGLDHERDVVDHPGAAVRHRESIDADQRVGRAGGPGLLAHSETSLRLSAIRFADTTIDATATPGNTTVHHAACR